MNKFYIQIVFFLLSITLYANNKTLATEPALGKATKSKSKESYLTPMEIYLKNTDLLCNNRNEVINAEKLMNDAVKHLEYHATSEDGYEFVWEDPFKKLVYYQKEHEGHIKFNKFKYPVRGSDKYNEEINKLWDPYVGNLLDYVSTKRKIERVYSPNLIMIQQLYRNCCFGLQRYFYVLVKKTQISKDKTIIAMTSANIIDHHPSTKKYKNKIIESANLFTTEVDSEDDIRNGKIKKTYVNIAGYLIEKKGDDLEITYIDAIDGNTIF